MGKHQAPVVQLLDKSAAEEELQKAISTATSAAWDTVQAAFNGYMAVGGCPHCLIGDLISQHLDEAEDLHDGR